MRTVRPSGVVAAFVVLLLISSAPAQAQVFELIDSFAGCPPEGCSPGYDDAANPYYFRPLLRGPDGNFYGISLTDWREGEDHPRSFGTVYRVSPNGARVVLHRFDGTSSGGGGALDLAFGADGLLYGLGSIPGGTPILFRLNAGAFEILTEFPVGYQPFELVAGPNGALYGGGSAVSPFGPCAMFKWDGTLSFLDTCASNLRRAPDGHMYFPRGGSLPFPGQFTGDISRFTPDERIETVYDFAPNTQPTTDMIINGDGTIYGAGALCGPECVPQSIGVYRLTPTGVFSYIPNSRFLRPLGAGFDGSVIVDGGLTSATMSWLRPDGMLTPLHTFADAPGTGVLSALTRGLDGHLYGIRSAGGEHGVGVFFRIRMPGVDMKANGADAPTEVGAGDPLTISMAFDASATDVVNPSEVYLAVVTPALQILWTTPTGFSLTPAPLYSGPLPSFPLTPLINIPDAAVLPAGDYYWVAIVDADSNRAPNGHYVDFVKTTKRAEISVTRRPH